MRGQSRRLAGGTVALGVSVLTLGWAQAPPEAAEQEQVLKTVAAFSRDYIQRLPDFTCRRVTQHFRTKAGTKDWQPQVKVTEELSFYGHQEHYQIVEINDVPKKKIPFTTMAEGYVATSGNFGWILEQLFDPASKAAFHWSGWDNARGKRCYSFRYRVAKADSKAQSGKCTSFVLFQNCKAYTYAYHGLVFVDAETMRIARVTHEPEGVPPAYVAGQQSVDYEMVTVAGEEYLLPAAETMETTAGKMLFRNESVYNDYKKFTAESSLKTTMGPVPPPSPPPAPTAHAPRSAAGPKPTQAAHYFELRDDLIKGKVPLVARGAVAAAFNDVGQAESDFRTIINAAPDTETASVASNLLAAAYARNGKMRQALAELERHGGQPDNADWRDSHERLAALARAPEQSVAARGYSKLRYTKKRGVLVLRLAVNGKEGDFSLDSGAALSVISEGRAKEQGLTIRDEGFAMADIAGKKLPCRVGVAGELVAGAYRLRNVPFCVLPDNQPGFVADPESPAAILGLGVLLAFDTIRWDTAGNFEIGVPSRRPRLQDSNICFDSSSLLMEATVDGRKLSFVLDMGNPTTMLFPAFTEDLAADPPGMSDRALHEFQGLGESAEVEAAALPEVRFRVGGKELAMRKVPLLMDHIESECSGCAGNVGMDLLDLARRVTLDFKAMRLVVETGK